MSEQSPLSDDLLELLDAEREPELVPPATRERMFARLAPLLVPPGGGGGIGGTPSGGQTGAASGGAAGAAASAAAGAGWTAKLILSAVSLVVGIGGGAAGHAWLTSPKPVADVVAAASSEPVATAPSASSEAAPPADEPAPSASSPASPSSSQRSDARGAASLTAERLLLETATAALVRGDNASAIATLRKHAHQFPRGELAQEREALLVQALAASGDDAAAQQHAKDFKKKFPGSLQQGAVDKVSGPR